MIVRLAERPLRTRYGPWTEILYFDGRDQCIALVCGDVRNEASVPVRLHSDCISAHVFNSIECDCREQMMLAQAHISGHGRGVILWLDQDGRGNGHMALMRAALLASSEGISQSTAYTDLGFPADKRSYESAVAVIRDLGIVSVELLSDSPSKLEGLEKHGVTVERRTSVSLNQEFYPHLSAYYADKIARGYRLEWRRQAL